MDEDKIPVVGVTFDHARGAQVGVTLFVFCALGGKFLGALMIGGLGYIFGGLVGALLLEARESREERERATRLGGWRGGVPEREDRLPPLRVHQQIGDFPWRHSGKE